MNGTQESYADKIAKLLRKAESTTPEEAELLFAKAQELMAKYAIDEAMLNAVRMKEGTSADPVVWNEFVTVGIYRHALYMIDYYTLVCYGCKVIEIGGSPWKTIDGKVFKQTRVLRAVGFESDISKARIIATSLKLQCMRAESVWWKEHSALYTGSTKQHAARRGFMLAFGSAAFTKMKEATAKARTTADAEHGASSVALVLRDKGMILADEFNKQYPKTRSKKSRLDQGDIFARGAGREAGQRADVGQSGMGGTSRREIGK